MLLTSKQTYPAIEIRMDNGIWIYNGIYTRVLYPKIDYSCEKMRVQVVAMGHPRFPRDWGT